MFTEPGKSIKKIAKAFFALLIIIGIIAVIALISDKDLNPLLGIIILAVWVGIAWLLALFLSAFGELVESSEATKDNTAESMKLLEQLVNRPVFDYSEKMKAAAPDTNTGETASEAAVQTDNEKDDADFEMTGYADINVGDTLLFGTYQQEPGSGAKTDIEWIVIDKQDGSIALLSKYILDCQPFNKTLTDATWENCTLRKWLNDTFYRTAFSEQEQKMIQSCFPPANNNPRYGTSYDKDTEDKVFLLSAAEAEELLSEKTISQNCAPTAVLRAYWKEIGEGSGWWLRSPGASLVRAAVIENGSVNYEGNYINYYKNGVRPALRITIE